ncbi:MAG: TonB family protein, partial [Bacteroidota bacterium]|nr:TonB family protein [Bacteroidota bacterium]
DGDSKTAGSSSDSTVQTAGTTDSASKDSMATASRSAKKKRKASVSIATPDNDKIVRDKEGVYNRAEVMPEYPGGQNALSNYINDQFGSSQTTIDDNTTGTVRVSFIVDEKGKVTDVHLLGDRRSATSLDDQVVKVISNMPAWTPGKVKGKNVKTRLELPIVFELEG